jgi:rhomboid protease GluP
VKLEVWADGLVPALGRGETFDCERILNVETSGNQVRLEIRPNGVAHTVILQLPDGQSAAALAAMLPKTRTADFTPRLGPNPAFIQTLRAGVGTWGVLIANVILYLCAAILSPPGRGFLLPDNSWGANVSGLTLPGEPWRLLSAQFLHANLRHLTGNLLVLIALGPLVERLLGVYRFLGTYLFAGVCGNLLSLAVHPGLHSVGASGAIFGLVGCFAALWIRSRTHEVRQVIRAHAQIAIYLCISGIGISLSDSHIDIAAHIGGLLAGFASGLILARPEARIE